MGKLKEKLPSFETNLSKNLLRSQKRTHLFGQL
jgi:hypothetical protein